MEGASGFDVFVGLARTSTKLEVRRRVAGVYSASFECPVCGGKAEASIRFLDRNLNAEILAFCSGCGSKYYERDRGWRDPIVEMSPNLPLEFTNAAANALSSAINAAFQK